jgi:hypothetical protein
VTQSELMDEIAKVYERMTGRMCDVKAFCVPRDQGGLLGVYSVHPIPSGDIYLVNVRRLSNGTS